MLPKSDVELVLGGGGVALLGLGFSLYGGKNTP